MPLSVIHLFPTCTELPEVTESRFCFILFSPSDTGRDDVHVSEMENEVLEGLGQGAGSRIEAGNWRGRCSVRVSRCCVRQATPVRSLGCVCSESSPQITLEVWLHRALGSQASVGTPLQSPVP